MAQRSMRWFSVRMLPVGWNPGLHYLIPDEICLHSSRVQLHLAYEVVYCKLGVYRNEPARLSEGVVLY